MRSLFAIALLFLLSAGCVETHDVADQAPGPVPVRDFLHSGSEPRNDLGAYGYLVFTSRPVADTLRYLDVCTAFIANIEPISEYLRFEDVAPESLMATYWLLEDSLASEDRYEDCGVLIEEYDYARASLIASSVDKLGSKGPVLVAWERPFQPGMTGTEALVLDMSDFSNADMSRAFRIWKERIVRDPRVWKEGYQTAMIVEAFRNLIQRYGEEIISVIRS